MAQEILRLPLTTLLDTMKNFFSLFVGFLLGTALICQAGPAYGPYSMPAGSLLANVNNNVLQSQVTTNSLVGNFNSHHWGGSMGGAFYVNPAFKNGGEYILNQQSNSCPTFEYIFALPPSITNLSVNFSMRSLNGNGSLYVQFSEGNGNNIAQRQIALVTNSYTNITLTTTLSDFAANGTNAALKFLLANFPFCISNLTFTVQTANPDPVMSSTYKRIEVLPRNVWSANFVANYVSDKNEGNALPWENVTAAGLGGKAYTEFVTDAASVNLELSCINSRVGTFPNTVYVDGNYYTNIVLPVNNSVYYMMTNLYLGNAGVSKRVTVYNSENESSLFPNYVRAILVPVSSSFAFTRAEPRRKIFVVGDSIMAGNRSYGDQSQDIWNIIGNYMDAEIVRHTMGGASLNKLWQTNITKKTFLHALNVAKPDCLYWALGANDKGNNYYGNGTNGFSQDISNLLATVHYQFPSMTVYVQNMLYTTDAAATGGYTVSQYRDAITSEATRAANWCVLLDASTWIVAADLEDQYHPSLLASGKIAAPVIANLITNTIVVRP